MKKKLLTFALAAAMAISSAFSSFAATADVDITGGLGSANTGDEAVTGDFDVTYTFKNKSHDASANWNNFAVEVSGEGFGITARADAFAVGFNGAEAVLGGWGDNPIAPTTTWTGLPADWAAWAAGMADADVTVNVKRNGKVLTLAYTIVSGGQTYNIVGTTPEVDMPDALNLHITGEKVALSNVSFKDNKASDPATEPSEDTTNPSEDATKPSEDATKPSEDATKPSEDSTEKNPSGDSKDPVVDPTKPGDSSADPTKPGDSSADPTKPDDSSKPVNPEDPTEKNPSGIGTDPVADDTDVVPVGEETVSEIAKDAKVDNAPEGAEIKVNAAAKEEIAKVQSAISADGTIAKLLKGKKVMILDLKLMKEGAAVQPNGMVKVTLATKKGFLENAKYVRVLRLDGDKLVPLGVVEVKNGLFAFETNHFSTYVFAEATEAEFKAANDDGKGGEGQTGDSFNAIPLVVLAVVAVGGVLAVSLKKKNAQ